MTINVTFLVLIILGMVVIMLVVIRLNSRLGGFQDADKQVRDELRTAREEARGAAKELREEVSGGLGLTNDTISKTLEGMRGAQQGQLEGMTKQLKELSDSNQVRLDQIRSALDSRMKELQ